MRRNARLSTTIVLYLLIITISSILAVNIYNFFERPSNIIAAIILIVVVSVYMGFEILGIVRYVNYLNMDKKKSSGAVPSALVLLNGDGKEIKFWDLSSKTGLIIGRNDDSQDTEIDIDLSGTEYFPLISHCHAVMNFADKNWYLSDNGSKNGTSIVRCDSRDIKTSEKCLLAPGESITVKTGDKIYIAEEVILLAK
jgi:hypothetical protein